MLKKLSVMLTPFIIYIRAVGLYMLITFPVLMIPEIYLVSVIYVLIFGWFAWAVFTILYLLCRKVRNNEKKMSLLIVAVIPSVATAFHILGLFNPDLDVWHSGVFMLFPVAGVLAGWISVFQSRKSIQVSSNMFPGVMEEIPASSQQNLR
jgi:hypothetical protein